VASPLMLIAQQLGLVLHRYKANVNMVRRLLRVLRRSMINH